MSTESEKQVKRKIIAPESPPIVGNIPPHPEPQQKPKTQQPYRDIPVQVVRRQPHTRTVPNTPPPPRSGQKSMTGASPSGQQRSASDRIAELKTSARASANPKTPSLTALGLSVSDRRKVRRLSRQVDHNEIRSAELQQRRFKGPVTRMKLRWHDAKAIATYDALDRIHARLTPTPVATQPGNDRGIPGRSPAAIESNVIDLNKSRAALGR